MSVTDLQYDIKYYYFNSKDRLNKDRPESSPCNFILESPHHESTLARIMFKEISIVNNFTNVNITSNKIYLDVKRILKNGITPIVQNKSFYYEISIKEHVKETIVSELQTFLNSMTSGHVQFIVSIGDDFRLRIKTLDEDVVDMTILSDTTAYKILGSNHGLDTSISLANRSVFVSPKIVDFSGEGTLYVQSEYLNNGQAMNSMGLVDVVASLDMSEVSYGDHVHFDINTLLKPKNREYIDIRIVNHNGQIMSPDCGETSGTICYLYNKK